MFLYANTAPAGIAGPYSVRLWVDRPSEVRPSRPLPAGMDKIQRQTHEHVYWMELTEPTLAKLVAGIDRILSPGFRYRMLVGREDRVHLCCETILRRHCRLLK